MTKTTTPNDLVKYIYNESTPEQKQEFYVQCMIQTELYGLTESLQEVKDMLDQTILEPSQKSIDAILNYSKSLSLHT